MALSTFFINFIHFLGELHGKSVEEHIVGFHTSLRK